MDDEYIRQVDEMTENQPAAEPKKEKQPKSGGFFGKMMRTVLLAVLFGAVAFGVFWGGKKLTEKHEKAQEGEEYQESIPAKPTEPGQTTPSPDKQGTGIDVDLHQSSALTSLVTAVDVSDLVESVMPSLVEITCSAVQESIDFFTGQRSQREVVVSRGSGIIIGQNSSGLLIVTNNHVVANGTKIEVTLCDGTNAIASVRGTAKISDLAVVSVSLDSISESTANTIRIARIGDSNNIKVGQMVVAIGNALGQGQSVTVGYISALNREITTETGITQKLMQTDAAINPGNSGGALFNQYGEVVGINSAKMESTDVEGMGYAIPISDIVDLIDDLSSRIIYEEDEQGYLGLIRMVDISLSHQEALNMPTGVYVQALEADSPADKAGILPEDIIVKLNAEIITTQSDIQEFLKYTKGGTKIQVTVMRRIEGEFREVVMDVTLGFRNSQKTSDE